MSGSFRQGGNDTIHVGAAEEVLEFEKRRGMQVIDNNRLNSKVSVVREEQRAATLAIQQRYEALGRAVSRLGLPLSDTAVVSADGRSYQMDYNGGHIVFDVGSGDTEAVVTKQAVVTYKGLKCFGRQSGGGDDEPYVIMSVVQTDPRVLGDEIQVASSRAPAEGTYTEVNDGNVRTEGAGRKFWASAPQDVVINSVVMEHDYGDPEKVRKAIEDALKQAADAGVAAVTGGSASAPMDPDTLQGMAVNWLAGEITDLLGVGDDKLGSGSIVIPRSTWMHSEFPPMLHRDGVDYNYVQYCTDGDASYDVMYEVHMEQVTTVLDPP